jgi:rubrerythrin
MFNTDISSTAELFSIATAAEHEANRRYSELASKMLKHGNEDAAAVFEKLAGEAKAAEKKITEWAGLEGLLIDADAAPVVWDDPNVDTGYDTQACNPYRCTPYKVLAFAVHNEERVFLFYTYVAADSHDDDVCHHAKVLARAKLDRAAALRVKRRRAWHEQSVQITESRINPAVINGKQDLLAIIIFIEQYLARLFELAGSRFTELKGLAASTRVSQLSSEKALQDGELPGRAVTGTLQRVARWRDEALAQTGDATAALRRLCEDCDRSFAFYDSVVKSTSDEQVMLMAQQQAIMATRRIAELRRLTDSLKN